MPVFGRRPGRAALDATRFATEGRTPEGKAGATCCDITGTTVAGEPVTVQTFGTGTRHLLAFFSPGCGSCERMLEELTQGVVTLPAAPALAVVTKGPTGGDSALLSAVEDAGVPVVVSEEAWERYGVRTSPYVVLVDGIADRVVATGAALDWYQVASIIARA